MTAPCEVSITVKTTEKNLKFKHLVYEEFKASCDDPVLKQLIHQAVEEFKDPPEKVVLRIRLDLE